MRYSKLLDTLQNLIEFKPSQAQLGEILGIKQTSISGRAQRDSNFSEEEIEKIEAFYGIDITSNNNCVDIDYIHINPSCGKGTIVLDEAEVTPVRIGREIIKNIWKSSPENLKLFKASGDSMSPVIEDGNILLVDTFRTEFNNGGIFLLTINNDWFIKRLRMRVTGELDIISDNDKYPIETIKQNSEIEIFIKGRVIKNLSRGL